MIAQAVPPTVITDRLVATVCTRLAANKRVRRVLPDGGRVHIDRQLPFLCLYRIPDTGADLGMQRLVTSEASYLFCPATKALRPGLNALLRGVIETLGSQFGGFLLLEVWPTPRKPVKRSAGSPPRAAEASPRFTIVAPRAAGLDPFVDVCEDVFQRITVNRRSAVIDVLRRDRISPAAFPPVLTRSDAEALQCTVVGVEIEPIYLNPATGVIYPLIHRELERQVTQALRQIFYTFAQTWTTQRPPHFHGLGRHAMVKAVWKADAQLAEVANAFDFLLQVTPYNAKGAWAQFQRSRYETAPVFRYRPLPIDPVLLKRRLYATPLERLEDPALRGLFREKQDELDRKLTMLLDINTPRFMHGSMQLYGDVEPDLVKLAEEVLGAVSPRSREDSAGGTVTVADFVARAKAELEYYRGRYPQMNSGVEIREDTTGLMVSRGRLLVNRSMHIPASRVDALLQHEIGTHIVTYVNGRAQPFRQLASGLAGYDALQEGLAVFAEFLVGGLSRPRLRLLAARVLAARNLLDGATFVDTFRFLRQDHGFDRHTAFTIALRMHRGGGLTKDAVYLSGLVGFLDYLQKGGSLEPLLVGKIAATHVPVIEELQWRRVLVPPPLRPRFLDIPGAAERLERARGGLQVHELIEGSIRP